MNIKKILLLMSDLVPQRKIAGGTGISQSSIAYKRTGDKYKACGDFKPAQKNAILEYRKRLCKELDYKLYELTGCGSEQNISTASLILECVEKDFVISSLKDYLLKYEFIPQIALQTIAQTIKCNQNQSISTFTVPLNDRKLVLIKHKQTGLVYFTYVVKHDGGFYYTLFEKNNVSQIVMSYKDDFIIF